MQVINKKQLLDLHKKLTSEALEVMKAKNEDYTAGSDDPFANFRGSENFGVPAGIGLLTRFQDKLKRAESFFRSGEFKVANESIADLGHDMINYAVLCTGLLLEIAALATLPDVKVDATQAVAQLGQITDKVNEPNAKKSGWPKGKPRGKKNGKKKSHAPDRVVKTGNLGKVTDDAWQ